MKVTTQNLLEAFPELSRKDALRIKKAIDLARKNSFFRTNGQAIETTLELADGLIAGSYGIEAVRYADDWYSQYWQDVALLYLNTGDCYNTTIIYYVVKNSFSICCLGDILERTTKFL